MGCGVITGVRLWMRGVSVVVEVWICVFIEAKTEGSDVTPSCSDEVSGEDGCMCG